MRGTKDYFKLTPLQKKVLSVIQENGKVNYPKLFKKTGIRTHQQVRDVLIALHNKGYLG